MVYQPRSTPADKAAAIVGVVLINAGVILAFLNLTGRIDLTTDQPNLEIFDVTELPPPPPEPPVVVQPKKDKPKEEEGKAAPENKKSQATPVKAPEPRIELPAKPPVVVAPTPGTGAQPTQGSGQNPGPGTGAGGNGNGTGAGGAGNGAGGGGSGGTGPRLANRPLRARDYPSSLTRVWPSRTPVFVKFRVQLDGRATGCEVTRSSGNPTIDQVTCSLVEQRLRFRPAVDGQGRPYVAWYGYVQAPVNF